MVRHPLVMASESSLRHSGTAEVAASIGVHVGEDSSYNVSELLPRSAEYPTSTLAELSAALRGLKVAAEIKKGDELARLENGRTGDRLSVNGYLDLRGNHSLHRELFWQLEEAVIKLEMEYRVQTLFWWVPRKLSWQADALASLAFKKRVVRPLLADRKPKREEDGGEGSDSLNEPQRDASIPDPGAVLPPSPPPPPPYCPPASQAPAPLAWGQQASTAGTAAWGTAEVG
ncbi:hypothetical protein B0A50_05072 [Salinomyces thailandicus]|uniref:Uncharacterized protein n=1 Tax=Salinomyces thailandicus TaxID=706561 RepID=A0A4U0TVA6_9PEZI|nr:hypothetical protein B0A50_05072 [Salinomyces thailandica]